MLYEVITKMPDADGVDILRQMRAESNIPEIIMFTGHGNIETAVECIKLGAYDYLTKPVKLDELEMVLTKADEKHRLRMENISLKIEVSKFENHRIVGKSRITSYNVCYTKLLRITTRMPTTALTKPVVLASP